MAWDITSSSSSLISISDRLSSTLELSFVSVCLSSCSTTSWSSLGSESSAYNSLVFRISGEANGSSAVAAVGEVAKETSCGVDEMLSLPLRYKFPSGESANVALLGVHGELRPPGWSIWILHITMMSQTIRKPFTHFSTLTRGFYPRPRTGRRDTIREDFKKLSAFLRIGCVDIVISIHSIPCLRSSIMFTLSLEDTNALKLSNFECECCSLGKVTVLFDKHKRTRRVALRVRHWHRDCRAMPPSATSS